MWLLKVDACGDEVWSGCPFVGIAEPGIKQLSELKVWPNPFSESLFVDLPNNCKSIVIRSALGEICFEERVFKSITNINIVNLASGIYLFEAKLENGSIIARKIVRD